MDGGPGRSTRLYLETRVLSQINHCLAITSQMEANLPCHEHKNRLC